MSKNTNDPLLAENPNRYVMFPLQDHDIWQLYKKMFDCMWRAEEIDFSKDMKHWESLTEKERHFVKMILAFFAASDGIVVENLGMRFLSEVQLPEARTAYGFQLMMENVHSETYSLLIDTYIKDDEEKIATEINYEKEFLQEELEKLKKDNRRLKQRIKGMESISSGSNPGCGNYANVFCPRTCS